MIARFVQRAHTKVVRWRRLRALYGRHFYSEHCPNTPYGMRSDGAQKVPTEYYREHWGNAWGELGEMYADLFNTRGRMAYRGGTSTVAPPSVGCSEGAHPGVQLKTSRNISSPSATHFPEEFMPPPRSRTELLPNW